MIRSALTSVTFRKLAPEAIIELAAQAGLAGIEWGGDVHVPPGDAATARRIASATAAAGLAVSSYGSYYRAGDDEAGAFEAVLQTALALGAPTIRIWAGRRGSSQADDAYRRQVADDAARITAMAQRAGVRVAYEFHGGTLTDTIDSAVALLEAISSPGPGCYWQPVVGQDAEGNLLNLQRLLPHLVNLHVFHWDGDGNRLALAEGADDWRRYLELAGEDGGDRWAILEFVAGDQPRNLAPDARTLLDLLGDLQ